MAKKYIVILTGEEQANLREIISSGKHSARRIMRANVLLKANKGWSDNKIAQAFETSIPTLERLRKLFVEEGVENALTGRTSTRVYERKIDGKREAQLISLACSESPAGSKRWTLHMLSEKMVQLGYIDSVSYETVRRVLKKRNKTVAL